VLIIGAGGVAHAASHKLAQHNDLFGNIYLASRSIDSCKKILDSIERKNNYKNILNKIRMIHLDVFNNQDLDKILKKFKISITLNLASPFCNMRILQSCINNGSAYIDTAIHEDPSKVCEDPPWYANYEWKHKTACLQNGITAILGAGFDPGVVNAYVAYARKHYFDYIDTVDIMDVNAGIHNKYFATNFDPEINFREFVKVWVWINKQWECKPIHSEKKTYNFPVIGEQTIYLTGHDEIHSLYKNINATSIRFWMGFSEHYLNCFNVLSNIGLLSEKPVRTSEGLEVVPLKVLKACLPNPKELAPNYTGKTCIGVLINGTWDKQKKEIFIYNICDHQSCYKEIESQAISYTAGVPAVSAAILINNGIWDVKKMVNIEELNPDPYITLLKTMNLTTEIIEINKLSLI
jgi:saccharopine dehydrogenase-like NADP-dependent oxidoreductase